MSTQKKLHDIFVPRQKLFWRDMEEKGRVCVTGAGGYIASWLVKLLLSKGYVVIGTVRDPADEKNAHLKKLEKAAENLQLLKADLLDKDSLAAAITGCSGVFHVASPVPFGNVPNPEVQIIEPAVTGTTNVLKVCSEAGVKRVVIVSSTGAVSITPNLRKGKDIDEHCWSDEEHCKKIGAEKEAWKYAEENNLDVVTICPAWTFGPLLQTTVNTSSLFLVKILKGELETMKDEVYPIVDVRDVAEALMLTYEKPEASGRYICAPHSVKLRDLVNMLKSMYPDYKYLQNFTDDDQDAKASSEKLKRLQWQCRPLEETLADSVEYFQKAGLLNKD